MDDEKMVYLTVPAPLYHGDAELNLMTMLDYLMRHPGQDLTMAERHRVAAWFNSRYGNAAEIGKGR